MLVVLCVDLDDDLGRTAGVETPVVGRDAVEEAAVALATADPEDSDANVLFQGLHTHDALVAREDDPVTVAAVAGTAARGVAAARAIGREVETVVERVASPAEPVRAGRWAASSRSDGHDGGAADVRVIVVTDGAQDESALPVIRSRATVDGVRRVVVRQAQDLESMYYTIKQVLNDPETRGTILVPLGIALLIYPLVIAADVLDVPGSTVFGLLSGLFGLYLLGRGLEVGDRAAAAIQRVHDSVYAGRLTTLTYAVAGALLLVGGASGYEAVRSTAAAGPFGAVEVLATLAIRTAPWLTAAAVASSVGRIADTYLDGRFEWRYLNAPFYALAVGAVLRALGAYLLGRLGLSAVVVTLVGGTLPAATSTLAFAVAESRTDRPRAMRAP